MAVLEDKVLISVLKNEDYYESLGYSIPRRVDKYGIQRQEIKSKILVNTVDLLESCSVKVTKVCDDCGKLTYNQPYNVLINRRKEKGKDRCLKCSKIERDRVDMLNIKYENSLENYVKVNNKEYLIEEFSEKNNKLPSEISKCTNYEYLWNCPDCKEEYTMAVILRTYHECNCPFCRGYRVSETNCLWSTHPEIAQLLVDSKIGYNVTYGSNKRADFICGDCGHIENNMISRVVSQGYSCKQCGDGISYPEKFMINLLNQLKVKFDKEKVFEWSKNIENKNNKINGTKRYDFYIPSLNFIVETHGSGHYKEGFIYLGGRSLKEELENDALKKELALDNGIVKYIVIDCRKSELDFIKNSVLNSEIAKNYNLDVVDWLKCHEFASNSLIKIACELWNMGNRSTKEISKIMNSNKTTINRYLKKGVELGWCDYDPKNVIRDNTGYSNAHSRKRIVQLTMNGDFIKEWESMADAKRHLKVKAKISDVCRGKQESSAGFKWMYIEDYEKSVRECQI